MIIRTGGLPPNENRLTIEEVTDPVEIANCQRRHDQFHRNIDWWEKHWEELVPRCLGKYLAIAGQQAFVADTVLEACAQAKAANPEDEGVFVQYVRPEQGPRINVNSGTVALLY